MKRWRKAYRGPFERKEADELVRCFKKIANPEVNLIYDADTRKRKGEEFDVLILTEKI